MDLQYRLPCCSGIMLNLFLHPDGKNMPGQSWTGLVVGQGSCNLEVGRTGRSAQLLARYGIAPRGNRRKKEHEQQYVHVPKGASSQGSLVVLESWKHLGSFILGSQQSNRFTRQL